MLEICAKFVQGKNEHREQKKAICALYKAYYNSKMFK